MANRGGSVQVRYLHTPSVGAAAKELEKRAFQQEDKLEGLPKDTMETGERLKRLERELERKDEELLKHARQTHEEKRKMERMQKELTMTKVSQLFMLIPVA